MAEALGNGRDAPFPVIANAPQSHAIRAAISYLRRPLSLHSAIFAARLTSGMAAQSGKMGDGDPGMRKMGLRRALWRQLDPEAYERDGLSPLNRLVILAVIVSSLSAILETEPTIQKLVPNLFIKVEQFFGVTFLIEYLTRIWAEGENPKYRGIRGRFLYVITPAAIIDLIALLPALLAPAISNLFLLRVFRLMRILRLARLGRFSLAMHHLTGAIGERREELLLSVMLAGFILVFSSAAMYMLEGEDNPSAFGSIPRALWWSVCTLTTVGYGDIYPHTVLGKICGGLTSIAGVGLIAMPTGILAAAFSESFQRSRRRHMEFEPSGDANPLTTRRRTPSQPSQNVPWKHEGGITSKPSGGGATT